MKMRTLCGFRLGLGCRVYGVGCTWTHLGDADVVGVALKKVGVRALAELVVVHVVVLHIPRLWCAPGLACRLEVKKAAATQVQHRVALGIYRGVPHCSRLDTPQMRLSEGGDSDARMSRQNFLGVVTPHAHLKQHGPHRPTSGSIQSHQSMNRRTGPRAKAAL